MMATVIGYNRGDQGIYPDNSSLVKVLKDRIGEVESYTDIDTSEQNFLRVYECDGFYVISFVKRTEEDVMDNYLVEAKTLKEGAEIVEEIKGKDKLGKSASRWVIENKAVS